MNFTKNKGNQNPFYVHPELFLSNKYIYERCGFICTSNPVSEPESSEYGAFKLSLNTIQIEFRVAKTTPTKNGHFVTLWKRIDKEPIAPYDIKDPVDLFVVCIREGDKFGQFVFPKHVLVANYIVSSDGKSGKRAFRVYAPWIKTKSPQASKTQNWQIKYFVDLSGKNEKLDFGHIRKLYACR